MEKIVCLLVVVLAAIQAVPVLKHIVSGQYAAECEFPHMAYIEVNFDYGPSTQCGATLISEKHVLTAAHCLEDEVESITVHLGSITKANEEIAIPVKQWAVHHDFDIGGYSADNDVALMELSKPVHFSRCIQPIALPKKGEVFSGTCVAAGWGYTGVGGYYPTELKKADVKIIPTSSCKEVDHKITAQQNICVGDYTRNGTNVCHGDSGGGLVCQDKTGKPVVAGVASYVFDCNEGFGVFANTENFLDFIKDHMDVWQ